MTPDALQRIHTQRLDAAYDAAGIDAYQHPAEIMEPAEEAGLVQQFAEIMTPVCAYIAKGSLTGTMDMRSWVFLYLTRLDMIHGETIAEFASRRGVSPKRVQVLINEFRALVPGMRSPHQKSPATIARMRDAHRRQPRPGTPPGKESFCDAGSKPGSAGRLPSPRKS
jgi:hypothetical protein